jgi:hypothetical protein
MTRRWQKVTLFLVALGLVAIAVYAASFTASVDGNMRGIVGSPTPNTISLGPILTADGNNGSSTNVVLPGLFNHYVNGSSVGTWTKEQIVTPNGAFVLKATAKLAGRKTLGIWLSKRNVFRVEVHAGNSASGALLTTRTIDKSVGSPQSNTLELPMVGGAPGGTNHQYTILVHFDKYDNDGGNDGQTGYTLRVAAN